MKAENCIVKNCYISNNKNQDVASDKEGSMFQTNKDGTEIVAVNSDGYAIISKAVLRDLLFKGTDGWLKDYGIKRCEE